MKTIAIKDLVENKLRYYQHTEETRPQSILFRQKRWSRILEAIKDIKHTGNIAVYLVNGRKTRLLFIKGL